MFELVYHWLYTHIGGRPWTYIFRDYVRKHPFANTLKGLIYGLILGAALRSIESPLAFAWMIAVFLSGVLCGHLLWAVQNPDE